MPVTNRMVDEIGFARLVDEHWFWSKRREIQKRIWITRYPDHKGDVSGQNEEKSKK
ncbi:MAG: hypothetical protein QM270_05110 [Bacillota bacterium]|nr:hypothetical protein [Bacillota bacterium]